MKLPRTARMLRGPLDAAPFAAVFFLLMLFLMLSALVYTPPGIHVPLDLPTADGLPGPDTHSIAVAIDANGQFYFQNQLIGETDLRGQLRKARVDAREPLTLIAQADKSVTYERLLALRLLARDAGIQVMWLEALPRPGAAR